MGGATLSHPVEFFQHLAMFYEGPQGFSDQLVPYISSGLDAGESVLVAVGPEKTEILEDQFGRRDDLVFADIEEVGRNPARIIPLWASFADENRAQGKAFRGVGEPIWRGRSSVELVECERHEALLNIAFRGTSAWILACPYDVGSLDAPTLAEARRNHPWLAGGDITEASETYRGADDIARPFSAPLEEPSVPAEVLRFTVEDLSAVRRFVRVFAAGHGLDDGRVADLVLAADEVAANSIRYGGGAGLLRCWFDGDAVVCEARDEGRFTDVMAGRQMPTAEQRSGYGLWLANQVCDLVQIRSFEESSVVRIHLSVRR